MLAIYSSNKISILVSHQKTFLPDQTKSIKRVGDFLSFILMFFLFVLCAFRSSDIGNDTASYIRAFKNLIAFGEINDQTYMEKGYQVFSLVVGHFFKSSQAIIIASAIVTYLLSFIYFKRTCFSPPVAICAFYAIGFASTLNTIRQGIAVSILFFAYSMISNKKYVKASLLILIATAFHTVSIVMFLYMALQLLKFRRKIISIVTICVIPVAVVGDGILSAVFQLFPQYSMYVTESRIGTGWLGIIFSLAELAIVALIYCLCTNRKSRQSTTKWLFIFTTWIYILGFSLNIFSRVASIFFMLLLVPVVNEIIISKKNIFVGLTLFVITLNLFFIMQNILRPEWNYIYPYRFFK